MHFSTLLLLPLLVAADQVPLMDKAAGWFDKAKAYVSSAVPSVSVPSVADIPNPIDAGAGKVAERVVEKVNTRNWQRKLKPKPDTEEEWMVYLTGGNKTCFGKCGPMNLVWNESVPLLTALAKTSTSAPLKLGLVDCEKDEVLCTSWGSGVPIIYHFLLPRQSEPQAPTPLHIIPLNLSQTEVSDITSIPRASKSRYLDYEEYTGYFHPIDGLLAKFGLMHPFGYFMWALGSMPGWVMMLGISFVSRQIMSRRMGRATGVPAYAEGQRPEGAPAKLAPQAGSPKGSGGGAKKRK